MGWRWGQYLRRPALPLLWLRLRLSALRLRIRLSVLWLWIRISALRLRRILPILAWSRAASLEAVALVALLLF